MSRFSFKLTCLNNCIGIAVDKNIKNKKKISITSFYFWPRVNGWLLLKSNLRAKPWLPKKDRISILNGYAKIIYSWKEYYETGNIASLESLKKDLDFVIVGIH